MEERVKALKTASNVISVITKIGYTAMVVMMGICAALLIYLVSTGGSASEFTLGGTNIIIFDKAASTPGQHMAMCAVLIVMGAIFLAVFLLASRMFQQISLTGEPFTEKYGKTVRAIGILIAAAPIALGLTETVTSALTTAQTSEMFTDLPGIVAGAIVFCLSYIIDYGCGLEKKETV